MMLTELVMVLDTRRRSYPWQELYLKRCVSCAVNELEHFATIA